MNYDVQALASLHITLSQTVLADFYNHFHNTTPCFRFNDVTCNYSFKSHSCVTIIYSCSARHNKASNKTIKSQSEVEYSSDIHLLNGQNWTNGRNLLICYQNQNLYIQLNFLQMQCSLKSKMVRFT